MAIKIKALITLVVGKAQEIAPGQECEVSDEEAKRLINLLRLFLPIPSDSIPQDSILREFIGGSCFHE